MQGDHQQPSTPPILPILETDDSKFRKPANPNGIQTVNFSPTSPTSHSSKFANGGVQHTSLPSFRRHQRRRSSTIYVPPRHQAPNSPIKSIEVPSGFIRGVTTLAGAQVLAKLLTFLLNQALLRFLGARELGLASQLELLISTALALSRDALRLANQRQSQKRVLNKSEYTTDGRSVLGTVVGSYQESCNLGWLAFLIGSAVVILMSSLLLLRRTWSPEVVLVTALAAVTELIAEPCFLLSQFKLQLGQRAKAESLGNVIRVLVVAFTLLVLRTSPFLGFALGHLGYSITLALVYYAANHKSACQDGFNLVPAKIWISQDQQRKIFISDPLWNASMELSVQQIVKYVLTEGDKLAVSFMTSLEEQGEYALAANYGSLIVRLVFAPLEEALRGYFTKTCPKEPNTVDINKTVNIMQSAHSPQGAQHSSVPGLKTSPNDTFSEVTEIYTDKQQALKVLCDVLRCYSYLGIFSAGFGPLAVPYLLKFVVRSTNFSGAASVLSAYAYYIPIMAWCGTLEALVQSTAPLAILRWQGGMMAGMAFLFVMLTYLLVTLLRLGGAGIVWAQVAVMSVRISWSAVYASSYFSPILTSNTPSFSLYSLSFSDFFSWIVQSLPNWYVALTSFVFITSSHVFIGEVKSLKGLTALCSMAIIPAACIALIEKELIVTLKRKWRGSESSNKLKEE